MQENLFDKAAERIVSEMYSTGTDSINYNQILKKLPTNVEEIKKNTGLTKVPVYKRLKDLEIYVLVRLEKGTSNVSSGKTTKYFMQSVSDAIKNIKENMGEDIMSILIYDSIK